MQPYYQSNLAPIHSDLWKNTFEDIDEFVTVNKGYPNNSKVIDNVIANPQKVDYSQVSRQKKRKICRSRLRILLPV